jgi:hypothetical protein
MTHKVSKHVELGIELHKPKTACPRLVIKPICGCSSIRTCCSTIHIVNSRVGGGGHDVFGIEPHKLVEASGGVVTDLKRG